MVEAAGGDSFEISDASRGPEYKQYCGGVQAQHRWGKSPA